ncbi:MAG: NUDIX domain-containing protein [Candidatus Diapherotrites archaeon]|nr:NUDIX domain-containing protein [Candidatus Diapherotrites archaeon]
MEKRRLVGIIVFDGEKFLLLHRVLNWRGWEYPKGGLNGDETCEGAIGRELFEETGLKKFEIISKVNEFSFFDSSRRADSIITNYLVRVSSNSKVSFRHQALENGELEIEHDSFKWFFPKKAVQALTHKDKKETLRETIKILGLEGA